MRFCDIVMKGGVTSGIVYPAAVCEIAKRFVFKNVGGTSAGAIAAALTAAAEFARQTGQPAAPDAGFSGLGNIPNALATNSLLFNLFHPNADTRSLYYTVLALAGRQRLKPAAISRLLRLLRAYPIASVIGAAPGGVLLGLSIARHAGPLAIISSALLTLLGIAIADAAALSRDFQRRLARNYYGLITGLDPESSTPVLTQWLNDQIQKVAGLPLNGSPLTFSMLWSGKNVSAPLSCPPKEPVVNLEMITTSLTFGRPYQFPLSADNFYFKPAELSHFFPACVITWMTDHARSAEARAGYVPLPSAGDLPVIVATRMSLSFPVLLSAVPLHAVDYAAPPNSDGLHPIRPCWFSDGGLSSNFPVALFDSPLPRWPTFAINLQAFPNGGEPNDDEAKNVFMPLTNTQGRLPVWTPFENVGGFMAAIVNAMQNWHDVTLMPLPGYRDRIVTIYMSKKEGGLNLDMPPDVLERLRKRGAEAGKLIAARFDDPQAGLPQSDAPHMNWDNHRWLRYRTTMGALRSYLSRVAFAYVNPQRDDSPYRTFIRQTDTARSYPIPNRAKKNTDALTDTAAALGTSLEAEQGFEENLPRPLAELGVKPPLES